MLEVLRDRFQIAAPRMRREIQSMHRDVVQILASKGIAYRELRSGLVPNTDKHEAAFIFDSTAIDSSHYGPEVFNQILPLLEPQATQSVLCGDLLGDDQELIVEILSESMTLSRSFTFKHATMLYGVYINNLSDSVLTRLHQELGSFPAYLGYIPATFTSRAKIYLSLSLANFFLKHKKTIILGHEADRSNDENINITPYELENFGHKIVSLQTDLFGIFLSFKIERPVYGSFEIDTQMALNSISDNVTLLDDFVVLLDEAKHGYLINNKLGKLKKAGLADADRAHIASLIQSKICASYIYNLVYLHDHNVMKFNLIIEVDRNGGYPTRLMVALEYIPSEKTIRVITLH